MLNHSSNLLKLSRTFGSHSPRSIAHLFSSHTRPDAFFVDVYFNAHPIRPIPQTESKDKQRAPNALVPTVIAYAGGQVDFTVDMGTEVRDYISP